MRNRSTWKPSAFRLLSALVLAGCGGDRATPPPVSATPAIVGIQPASLSASSAAQSITITGADFDSPTLIITPPSGAEQQFAGSQLSSATRTAIAASLVLSTPGTWRAQVKNGTGKTSGTLAFTVGPAAVPVVQNVAVDHCTGMSCIVSVSGSGFLPGLSAILLAKDGTTVGALTGATIENPTTTSFRFRLTTSRPFQFLLVVVNPDGQPSTPSATFRDGPAPVDPTITSISPASISASPVGQLITVSGTGFENDILANFTSTDGAHMTSARPIESASSTSARFFVVLNAAGTWTLTLRNKDLGEATKTIVIGQPNPNAPPAPQITSITPGTLTAADAEQVITIVGSGFQHGLTVSLSDSTNPAFTKRITAVTPTSITIAVTLQRAGPWSVSVRNPDYVPSNRFNFSVAPRSGGIPVPTLSAVPVAVTTSFVEQTLILNGTGFREDMFSVVTPPGADLDVTWGGVFVRFLSSTQAELRGTFDRAGTWRVRVTNGVAGQSSNEIGIVASYPSGNSPAISGLDPAQPYALAARQTIKVLGANFQPGLRLFVVLDDSSRAWTPVSGTVDSVTPTSFRANIALSKPGRLQVQNPDGRVSNIVRFSQRQAPPTLSVGSDSTLVASPNMQTVILGASYLQTGVTLTLTAPNGDVRPASNVVVLPYSAVRFDATLNITGLWRVRAKNPDGQESAESVFHVYASHAPTITDFAPAAPQTSHTEQPLTIIGTGFAPGATVTLSYGRGGVPPQTFMGAQIANLTPTSLQVNATLFPSGVWTAFVTNPEGPTAQRDVRVSGTVSPPSLSTIGPTPFVKGSGRLLTVTGANFHPYMPITLSAPNGMATTSMSLAVNVTLTSFQFYWTFDQSGTWSIKVANSDNQTSNSLTFTVP